METPSRRDAYEAIYDIEEELGERLIEASREPIGLALATVLVESTFEEVDGALHDLVDAEPIRQKLETYFDSFATADFFQELHELGSTLKIGENIETYLYVGELRFNRASYPLFYLPLSGELGDDFPHHLCTEKPIHVEPVKESDHVGSEWDCQIDMRMADAWLSAVTDGSGGRGARRRLG